MTARDVWHEIGAGETVLTNLLRWLFLGASAVVFYFFATLPLSWPQQAVCGLLTLLLGMALARWSESYLITLTLMMMSLFASFRYGFWRIRATIFFFMDPGSHWGVLDAFFINLLILAELYSLVILFLGYFQTIWPLRRAPVALPDDTELWPHVDVLIPTYNEPLEVVRYTALGALNIDWPAEKLHVYILDDGRRQEFERFAFEAGVGYRIREDNKHAKAGNINRALQTTTSPYVAIFDCDHVPTRSFLQMTMGWFQRDPRLAMLQTPHHFYSPDPFERNLEQFRVIPNEGELFYGIVQDGNDFWNATFFCGSCAVLRRAALDEVGGIATETVTEDAHTSLRLQRKGWNTAYINIPQAAGLATERLSAHVGQRIRWARGMIQILRTDNPLFAPGLKFAQRLCYFNAMMHFLYAVPRLIFLSAPLIYLLLSRTNVPGYWAAILAYALPHLTLSNITNSRIQGQHRHSFWNEIYETVLSPYILLPTILALVNPKLGKFNVTAKGGMVRQTYFDMRIAQPFLVMLLLNLLGIAMAVPRLLIWDRDRQGTVIMNVVWCCFNVVILGVTAAVAREMRQVREHVRVNVKTPVMVRLADGRKAVGETIDLSSGGSSIRLAEELSVAPGTACELLFPLPSQPATLPSIVVQGQGTTLRTRFHEMTIPEQEMLTMVLYSRADTWLGWGESREADQPLRSIARIFRISMLGLRMTFTSLLFRDRENAPEPKRRPAAARAAGLMVLAVLAGSAGQMLGQSGIQSGGQGLLGSTERAALAKQPPPPAGQFRDVFSLSDMGSDAIELHGLEAQHTVYFSLPATQVVKTARIHVYYEFSPGLMAGISHLRLLVNGTVVAAMEPVAPAANGTSVAQDAEFAIPAELLVENNALSFQFLGHYAAQCEDPGNSTLWARVHRGTYLELGGDLLPLPDDLKRWPLPFSDGSVAGQDKIAVVFPAPPSLKAAQAAGILASYLGAQAENRALRFATFVGSLPAGNAIVIAENPGSLPTGLNPGTVSGPTLAMRTNPNDPYGKVLIVTGNDADETLKAAQALAIGSGLLSGAQTTIGNLKLPDKQQADTAPRWASTDGKMELWNYASAEALQGDGSAPLNAYFRLPPDLLFEGERNNATLHMVYRYNSIPIGPLSSVQVRVNNAFLSSLPLPPGQESSRKMETEVPVPVVNLRPFSNSLSFDFTFQTVRKAGCQDTIPASRQGAVLRDSYLDLSSYPHYAALPNLELFANAGFPFTRFADWSETTVVMPTSPSVAEMDLFLALMGHAGRQTGFPALRLQVGSSDDLQPAADRDFLILGTGEDQPAFDRLARSLPVNARGGQVEARETLGLLAPLHHAWWKIPAEDGAQSGELTATGTPDAVMEAIESPFAQARSIVAIHLKDANAAEAFLNRFLDAQQSSEIAGTVSVLHGSRFQSFRIGNSLYHVGALPPWTRATMWFTERPYLASLIVAGLFFLIAVWIRMWLRGLAKARLRMIED